jgi:hypothetical protein
MSDTGLMVPIVYEPPGRYDVIIRVARDGGQLPDPVAFAIAADQAASRRSASIISVHMADTIINVVTVSAPDRYAALAVARAVVSDALKLQAPSPTQLRFRCSPGLAPVRTQAESMRTWFSVLSRAGACRGSV